MLPHSVQSTLNLMLVPLCAIVAMMMFTVFAVFRLGLRKALRELKPLWLVALINLVIVTFGSAVKIAPFYLHGCVWSPKVIMLISLIQSTLLLVLLVWIATSLRKWVDYFKRIDAQLKAGTNSPDL